MPRNPKYRDELLIRWKYGCIICGYNKKDPSGNSLLEAAHIKSYCKGDHNDSMNNIILLCRNHHKEYDSGYLDFDEKGHVYCMDETDPYHGSTIVHYPEYIPPGFVKYHNNNSIVGKKLIVGDSDDR